MEGLAETHKEDDTDATDRGWTSVPIPRELGERLRMIFGLGAAPATLGDLSGALGPLLATLSQEQLCAAQVSRHEVRTGERTLYMNCVMDALILPFLTGQPAEIRSKSPLTELVVTARIAPQAVEFTPAEAVISFGVAKVGGATVEVVCPYINAFPAPSEYVRWTAATPESVTMMLSLTDALAMAREAAAQAKSGSKT